MVVGCRAFLVLPPLAGAFSVIATPNYYRPIVEGVAGIAILVLAALVLIAAYSLNEAGGRLMRSGRLIGMLLCVASVICTFATLWLVLLGPALVLTLQRTS